MEAGHRAKRSLGQNFLVDANLQRKIVDALDVGPDDEALEKNESATRSQIAFYGSTPAYRGVLESFGYGDLQPELNRLSKLGDWAQMAALVDDNVLDAIATVETAPQRGFADAPVETIIIEKMSRITYD